MRRPCGRMEGRKCYKKPCRNCCFCDLRAQGSAFVRDLRRPKSSVPLGATLQGLKGNRVMFYVKPISRELAARATDN